MGVISQMHVYGDEGGGNTPQIPGAESEDMIQFLVFKVGTEMFALDVGSVREVIRVPGISWVPGAHDGVMGVINLRGSIIAVLNLAGLLMPGADVDTGKDCRIVVIESGEVTVGLAVDSVSEVAAINPDELEATMRTLDESQRNVVVSQTTIRDRIVGILDIDQVVAGASEKQSQIGG